MGITRVESVVYRAKYLIFRDNLQRIASRLVLLAIALNLEMLLGLGLALLIEKAVHEHNVQQMTLCTVGVFSSTTRWR